MLNWVIQKFLDFQMDTTTENLLFGTIPAKPLPPGLHFSKIPDDATGYIPTPESVAEGKRKEKVRSPLVFPFAN